MSRIVGLCAGQGSRCDEHLLDAMLAAAAGPGWTSHRESSGSACIGWSGWRAPVIAAGDGVMAVVDGRIYNRGPADSHVNDAGFVASMYREHGFEAMLSRLNGDFAVAVYDGPAHTLWIGRDRFGVKPLYYVADGSHLAFASRPLSLLRLPWVSADVNRRFVALYAASHYRYFDNEPHDSAYAGIMQLPAARCLRWRDGDISVRPYWQLVDAGDSTAGDDELADEYQDLLLDAVRVRARTSLRPIFTLSGGMDSSSVLAAAVRTAGCRQPATSAVYDDATFDETDEIRAAVDTLAASWHPLRIGTPDVAALVERMVAAHDEPVATATWLSHYLLCEQARALGHDAVFGGLGGDELNAGEYEHFVYFFADLQASGDDARLNREVRFWTQYHSHPLYPKGQDVVDRAFRCLVDLAQRGRCLVDAGRLRRYQAALNREFFDLDTFTPVMEHPFESYLKNRTFQDLTRETIPCCLRAEDRQATAFDLDHRLPFLDHRVVEFAYRLPARLKIRDGVSKHLLRQATRGLLPEETRTRVKKTGWNAPAHLWLSGRGRELLLDLVASRGFRERGIYDLAHVRRLIEEHEDIVRTGRSEENHMMFLWQLVNLELWLQVLSRQTAAAAAGP